ncbi:hypothetical protein A2U01_0053667, partial [Trifolium medium]|nr:hypothetical protein [Trifolium medium]
MEETGPSSPRGKGAMASVRREKEKALEEAGGRWIHRRVARQHPKAEPHADLVHVAQPHPDPAPEAEDDGEQLGEADKTVLALYVGHFARYVYECY